MMALRKIDLMHRMFGVEEQYKCGQCSNLACGRYHNKIYRKCTVYGMTHSEATDWVKKYTACGMYNMPYVGEPIVCLVQRDGQSRIHTHPLEGQISLFKEADDGN